jgi:DNA-binding transcriptional regulator YdaS (Cro superfamily)
MSFVLSMDATQNRATYRQTLVYALAIAGDEITLAARLGVSVPQLQIWLGGVADIPPDIFLRAVDVIVAATTEEIARSRGILNQQARI